MALRAMKELGVDKDKTFIIGDTINDIGLGVNAGIVSIGVKWGYNSKDLLLSAGANHLVSDANELNILLKNIID